MPDLRPTDDLPILRELGEDLKTAFRAAPDRAALLTGRRRPARALGRLRGSFGVLVAASSVIVTVGIAALAIVLLGHQQTTASPPSASGPTRPAHQSGSAAAPPANAIVFANATSDGLDARIEIAYVPASGGAVVTLTDAAKQRMVAAEPSWSPDGSQIAFVMSPRGHLTRYAGDGDIYVMNANGTDIHQLTHDLDASAPDWSPDGSQIAFIKGQGQALAIMQANGSDQHVIAHHRGYYESPAWSPDGRQIAYDSGPSYDSVAIFTIRPNGTSDHQLTPRSPSTGSPAWSPNGSKIAYSSGNRLWIMNPNATDPHPVTTPCRLPCLSASSPAWSPTASQLAFVREQEHRLGTRRYANYSRPYILDLSTGTATPIASTIRWAQSPTWRP